MNIRSLSLRRVTSALATGVWSLVSIASGAQPPAPFSELGDLPHQLAMISSRQQLAEFAATFHPNTPESREDVWILAAIPALSDQLLKNPQLLRYIVRYALFATALELDSVRKSPAALGDGDSLFAADHAVSNAFAESGFDAPGLQSLLARSPEIGAEHGQGYYRWIYLNFKEYDGQEKIFECSDVPFGGISRGYTELRHWPANVNGKGNPDGLSYTFPLNMLDQLVAAAELVFCTNQLPEASPLRHYARLIAARCFGELSAAEGCSHRGADFAWRAQYEMQEAIRGFNNHPPPAECDVLQLAALRAKLATLRFFAGNLRGALADYAALEKEGPKDMLVWARWGEAVCLFGLGHQSAPQTFRAFLTALDPDNPTDQRYGLGLVFLGDAVGKNELFAGPLPQQLEQKLADLRDANLSTPLRFGHALDMSRILFAIGRFDADAHILAANLKSVRHLSSANDLQIEKRYIEELGAAMNAVVSQLSWKMAFSATSSDLILRDERDRIKAEFAPSPVDKIKQRDPQGYPYGMQGPDEDQATCVETYLPNDIRILQKSAPMSSPASLGGISEFATWVNEEWENGNPIPYLKLVWLEWFYIPFLSLPSSGLPLKEWKYIPNDKSNLTSYSQFIHRFETRPPPPGSSVERVRKTFQEVFTILHDRYGRRDQDSKKLLKQRDSK